MLVEHATHWAWQAMGGTRIEVLCTALVFLGVLLVARCLQWLKHVRSLPPGPWGVPIFGYLPFLKGDVHLRYGELAKRYGPMFSARLGTQLVVVLSDHRTIRDTFRREEFTGRPRTEFINILGGYGIINTEGAMWKEQRKFLHEKLRGFGMTYMGNGRKIMESRIMCEVKTFLRGLASKRGAPTDVSASLGMSISNVICSLIMGVRFQHGDRRFKRFMDLIEEGFKLFGSMAAVNFVPVMRYLPCLRKVRNKISENRSEMAEFFQEAIDQHRATFDRATVRDLVDAYLLEIEKARGEGRASALFQGKNHDRQMQQILGDLFSAGMETVKTTLEWAIILMLHHPEAAAAVREELEQVVGRSRMPALEDLPFLPVTEATILEVLRRSSIVPLGTTHATTRDVTLHGYKIPAGSQVVPLLHAVHMDSELWHKPEEFRPSRFLSAEADRIGSWTADDKQNVWELSGLFEGDIMLEDGDGEKNGLLNSAFRWPAGVVPYYIKQEDFDSDDIELIEAAMNEYRDRTCIRFRPYRKTDTDYISIEGKSSGCWSLVGRHDRGQVVNLQNPGCVKRGVIVHELMHALGFYHQQSAANRDEWVTINWENVKTGKEHNFNKYDNRTVTDYGIAYDYGSVMHYSAYAFSKNGEPTITPKKEKAKLGQRKGLSEKDVLKLREMYKTECGQTEDPDRSSGGVSIEWPLDLSLRPLGS